jgi:DNA-binding LacI/PurR family transcriptional regulator
MAESTIITKVARSTIRDVANLAGVTPGTASLALNRDPKNLKITIETINRVKLAAKKLNYKPNAHAKRLADGVDSHPTVTVMTPVSGSFGGTHNQDVLSGILETAASMGINVNLRNTVFENELTPSVSSIGSPSMMEGIILHTWLHFTDNTVDDLLAAERPFVLTNHYVDNPRIPCVGGDMFSAGKKITEHLVLLGHKNIAVTMGPEIVCKVTSYLAGIRSFLEGAGIELPEPNVRFGSYESFDVGWLAALMKKRPRPTALICINDQIALAAIGALMEMGLSVPRDISVTGFGNSVFSALMHPQLTTLDEKGKLIGMQTMNMLAAMMDGKETSRKINLTFDLIARETTAPPS